MSLNKATLIGRLGHDPSLRETQAGAPVTSFSLATSESWKDKSGQKQERTEWHNIVVWGKLAQLCKQYLSKGSLVYVEGRIQSSEFEGKDGQKRHKTDIIATTVTFLQTNKDRAEQASEANASDDFDSDLPF